MSEEKSLLKRILWKPFEKCTLEILKSYQNGSDIKSTALVTPLENSHISLTLNLYPNGEDKASNANISLYLSVQSEEYVDFAVKFKVGILGRTPDENYFTQMIEKTAEDFGSQSSCKNESENKDDNLFVWGENVISHEELFKQEKNFIVDGELTIVCEVNITVMKYQLSSFNKNYLTRRIACDIHKMFDETKFLDIEMKCNDGEILKAHKAILASRSTVFYAIFSNCPKQPHNQTIEILDFDSTVMKEVLRFIYCTDIENLEKISRRLIFAAEKFQLEGLKKICIENIVANLSSKNVIRCLRLADRITKADRLFDECLETAISNYNVVKKSEQWKELPKDVMIRILDGIMKRFVFSNTVHVSNEAKSV